MKKNVFVVLLAMVLMFSTLVHAEGVIQLPKTGQTKCYATSGAEIACAGTGQDGEIQAGAAWPKPRFTSGTGAEADCMIDNMTGLMWPKNGNLPAGAKNWNDAIDYANNLTLCGHDDWRLPNVNELESLGNANVSTAAFWLNTEGFTNVQLNGYWSSSTRADNTDYAWIVSMGDGSVYYDHKGVAQNYVWPVRAGQSGSFGSSVIWRTGQTAAYRTGDDGTLQQGASWPIPRFVDKSNGTVSDDLTGLVWAKDANAPGPSVCSPGASKTWQSALDYVKCLNTEKYLGYNDWRLPNWKELHSLFDYSRYAPALPSDHPFINVQSNRYWSSSTYAFGPSGANIVSMWNGSADLNVKTASYYVCPVRAGQSGSSGSSVILSVSKSGTGSGTVTSAPTGINCGTDCSENYSAGTSVTLTAIADASSTFTDWSGDCSGNVTTCTVIMDASRNVTATFNPGAFYAISGIVKDFSTSAGIPGVTVTIKDASNTIVATSTTDPSGNFTAPASSTGDYTINAAKTGYRMSTPPQTVTLNETHTTETVSISMDLIPVAALTLNKTSLAFASTAVGRDSSSQTIIITSDGTLNLVIGTISKEGTDSASFTITSSTCENKTLFYTSKETCTIQVGFHPLSEGAKTAALVINSNNGNVNPIVNKTTTIPLTGTGIALLAMTLSPEWNFISLPKQPSVTAIDQVLSSILSKVRIIWGYRNETQDWLKYRPSGTNNTLATMETGKGYWIYMNEQSTLDITDWGPVISKTVPLSEEWNLAGYNGTDGTNVSEALQSIAGYWTLLWNWNNNIWSVKHATRADLTLPPIAVLNQGKAYWIRVDMPGGANWTQ